MLSGQRRVPDTHALDYLPLVKLLARLYELKWAVRDRNSRVIKFTAKGQRAWHDMLDLLMRDTKRC